jgi:hypothetical protein
MICACKINFDNGKHDDSTIYFIHSLTRPTIPDEAASKIIVFCRLARNAAVVLKHLQQRRVLFLNTIGDSFDRVVIHES